MTTANVPDLMAQATQSTANIGWLQEYLALWNLLGHTARRILAEQALQTTIDEQARVTLTELDSLVELKTKQLDNAYSRAYAKHLMLMDRVLSQEETS